MIPIARISPPMSYREWRLRAIVLIAREYYPESLAAIEQALAPALEIVDQVLTTIEIPDRIDESFYREAERRITERANRQWLEAFRRERAE